MHYFLVVRQRALRIVPEEEVRTAVQEAFDLLLGRTGLTVSAHPVAQTILLPWSELNILNDLFLRLSLIIEYRPLFAAR